MEEDEEDEEGEEEDDDDDDDDDAEGDEDDDMEDDDDEASEDEEHLSAQRRQKPQSKMSQSVASRNSATEIPLGRTLIRPDAKQSQFDLLALAKGLTPNLDRATLHEPDETILETERLMEKVHESFTSDTQEKRADVLGEVAQDLISLWRISAQTSRTNPSSSRSGTAANLTNASRLSSLLLSIHHPTPITQQQHRPVAFSLVPTRPDSRHFTPVPKVLLDWLNNQYSAVDEVDIVLRETGGYSRHESFWDAVQASAFRGNFQQTLTLLSGANFQYAETAQADGVGESGYSGLHLKYTNEAVREVIELLRECPAVAAADWDVKGHDWSIFRQRARQAYASLEELAEGDSRNRHSVAQPFQASHFGISHSQAGFNLSVASRRAESKVPWSVYENLSRFYKQLLGVEEEILNASADWVEATLGLTIWWDGEEEGTGQGSLAASRRTLARSQRVRTVDLTPVKAYCQRLSSALAAVIDNSDEDFSVNPTDQFEVGLACIIDDNIEGALQILRSWSLTVASAVAEIASVGEWFVRANGIMDQFDQSDLMVLSYTEQHPKGASKDDLLIAYSKLLASRGQVTNQDSQTVREGWELAIQVLGRLDDGITAGGRIERILNDLPLQSAERVDKIIQLCHNMGLSKHALNIALVGLPIPMFISTIANKP